jgi:uncharacterized coiled-coil protein SlyX
MKKIVVLFISCMIAFFAANAQTANEQLADKIAKRMKDSLSLTAQQQSLIYTLNLELAQRKSAVRQQTSQSDTLRMNIQKIENSRDSLYKTILTNEQYLLYRQKKRNLVNNN